MMSKPESVTVADARCPFCKTTAGVTLRANKKGHLYLYCPAPNDGGCLIGMQSRSDKGDALLATTATKWRSPEYRAAYVADAGAPKPADPPSAAPGDEDYVKKPARPAAAPASPSKATPPKRRSFLGGLIVDDEAEDE
jgi:hypothetical protein